MGALYDATWGRAFAALYDRGLKATEEGGLRQMRRELLSQASGRTIDLGAGTGVNLDLFPEAVGELVMAEPDPHMLKQLRAKAAGRGGVEVVGASAQELPFADDSFDTAVFTLVLCTVPDPETALREAARGTQAGWQTALHRARACRRGRLGRVAGPLREALAVPRRRLLLQPRHRGDNRSLAAGPRAGRAGTAAKGATDRAPAGFRQRSRRLAGLGG